MFYYFRITARLIILPLCDEEKQRQEGQGEERGKRVKIWTDASVFPQTTAHGGWSPLVLVSFLYSLGSPKDRLNKWFPLQPSTPGMALMIHTRKAEARRFKNQSGLHSETLTKTNK